MKSMRLQYASDLHLEKWKKTTYDQTLVPSAPVLVLLGDIAPLQIELVHPFFEWCSPQWETIVWIPGNLEVWGSGETSADAAAAKMKRLVSSFSNVQVLYNEALVSSDGCVLLGCPLWSIPVPPKLMLHVTGKIWAESDAAPFKIDDYKACFNWLRAILPTIKVPTVICSHYAPLPWLQQEEWIQEKRNSITPLPDLEKLLREPIVAWLYGHSHVDNMETYVSMRATGEDHSILFTANPRGYVAPRRSLYKMDAVLRIDPSKY